MFVLPTHDTDDIDDRHNSVAQLVWFQFYFNSTAIKKKQCYCVAKKIANSIQRGCRIRRIAYQIIAHGNSKYEMRQRDKVRRQPKKREHVKKYSSREMNSRRPKLLNSSGLPTPDGVDEVK